MTEHTPLGGTDSAVGYPVKLVRDRIPDALGGYVQRVTYGPVPPDQHAALLRAKLIEEAVEYVTNPSLGELADVLAVVQALAIVDLGESWMDVEAAADAKEQERGGFKNGLLMLAAAPEDR